MTFAPNGSGGYVAPPRVLATLVANSDGTYTFTRDSSSESFIFSASGQLTEETDPNGYVTTLNYSGSDLTSVVDPAGRRLTFDYGANGLISKVIDPMGHSVSFTYDSSGELTEQPMPLEANGPLATTQAIY